MSKLKNLIGQTFGRLTVIKRVSNSKHGHPMWECVCSCPDETVCVVRGSALTAGNTKSCGCIRKKTTLKLNMTHKKTGTNIYCTWANMKQRCYNPKNKQFKDWGGRGIAVCKQWRDSFEAFYKDVSKLPHFGEKGYSLNRKNNDGNYEPENVEWSNQYSQANNKRNNHLISYNGEVYSLSQWAAKLGIKRSTLDQRINAYYWSIDKAIGTPVKK